MLPTRGHIGSFELSTFGLMMALGFLAGGAMNSRAYPRVGVAADAAWQLLGWAMAGGVLGSKLWFVIEQVARDPAQLSALLELGGPLLSRGGLTWYGGLLGGALAVVGIASRRGLPVGVIANASAPSLAVGQALGRVGCFLVGDDYGRVTELPIGVAFPKGLPPTLEPVHPTQLYEFAWLSLCGALLWRRLERSPCLLGEYLILAGLGRLLIELVRTNPALVGPLTNAQVVALGCMAVGLAGCVRAARRRGPPPVRRKAPA